MNEDEKSTIGIGIDQGIANCGFAVIKLSEHESADPIVLCSGIIETTSKNTLPERMTLLYGLLTILVEKYKPTVMGCEKLFFNPKQKMPSDDGKKGRNKSASIVMTNMATGIIHLIAGQNQIDLHEFVPGTVKKYVAGSGKAGKEEVISAVKHLLQKDKLIEHEADAVAIGITAVRYKQDSFAKTTKKSKRKMKGGNKVEK